jgi:hypothetical protein
VAAAIGAFKQGDEVLSNLPGSSIMTVLAVDGLKVRCRDGHDIQYWFDTIMLERYEHPLMHCESQCADVVPRFDRIVGTANS